MLRVAYFNAIQPMSAYKFLFMRREFPFRQSGNQDR